MLPSAPATTLLWAWRLRRAADCDDERFLIGFVHAPKGSSTLNWSCDRVARTEGEARAYALRYGISPGSFTNALNQLRAVCAGGNADYVLSISSVGDEDCILSVSSARAVLHEPPQLLRAGRRDTEPVRSPKVRS
jgi:hypothetical protein